MSAEAATMPVVALGTCRVVFNASISYEPPLYLFPELLPKVEKKDVVPTVDAVDSVTRAVNLLGTAWPLVSVAEPLVDGNTDDDVSPAGRVAPFEFARLVCQGAFAPMHLDASALDPTTGFSSNRILKDIERLAAQLCKASHARVRSIVGRVLTPAELKEEEDAVRKVVTTNHFINVLAWQRLQELVWENNDGSTKTASVNFSTGSEGAAGVATNDKMGTMPSTSPWQTAYTDAFVACPEMAHEETIQRNRLLAQHLRGAPWHSLVSRGEQTDEALQRATAGVLPTTSPYANISKETPEVRPSSRLIDGVCRAVRRTDEQNAPVFVNGTGVWTCTLHSTYAAGDADANPETTVIFDLPAVSGAVLTLGRHEGYSECARVGIDGGLGPLTAVAKRISPHHATMVVNGKGHLIVVACGRNGLRVRGKSNLLAGHSVVLRAADAPWDKPTCIDVTPDLTIKIEYQAPVAPSAVENDE